MKNLLSRYAEVFMQISGALIILIPPLFLLVQLVRYATKWVVIYIVAGTVVAAAIAVLENYTGKTINKLLESRSKEKSRFSKKDFAKEQPHLGNCGGHISTPRRLSLRDLEDYRQDIQPPEDNRRGQITVN